MELLINELKKSYRTGREEISVLKSVSQTFRSGEVVAILGQSGSGKSTMLSLISGLDKADSGDIIFSGQKYSELSISQLTEFRAKNIGIIFQQFHLIPHLTALENILLPTEILGLQAGDGNFIEKARKLLTQVGLADREKHFPHQLSGGECQRVAIARALIVEPKLLLADEPSGSLDSKTGEVVMNLFFEIVRHTNCVTLLVTHNPDLAKRCDRILVLEDGILKSQK